MLNINEIFYSIQGEGTRTGRPTTFIRLSGCNLTCPWCDTNHKSHHELDEKVILQSIKRTQIDVGSQWVCITGGEPFAQNIRHLFTELARAKYKIQIETNGLEIDSFNEILPFIDLLTVSPKLWAADKYNWDRLLWLMTQAKATEVKLVIDGNEAGDCMEHLMQGDFPIYLQPESMGRESTKRCITLVKMMADERVRLGVQVHKIVGMR